MGRRNVVDPIFPDPCTVAGACAKDSADTVTDELVFGLIPHSCGSSGMRSDLGECSQSSNDLVFLQASSLVFFIIMLL